MCGRFASDLPPELVARLFDARNALLNIAPNWNTAPTQQAMVVRRHPETGERNLDALTWGLMPSWTKDRKAQRPINARAETVAKLPTFRQAFAKRRAIVPVTAFYEWRRREGEPKQPFAIGRADGSPLALAGLWEGWKGADGEVVRSFCILTTAANRIMQEVHDRMPVFLEPSDWPAWLGEVEGEPSALLRQAEEGVLRLWPVSTSVNSVRNNGPDLLRPMQESEAAVEQAPPGGPNPA